MAFFTRMLPGNSRLREAEQVNVAFKENLDNLEGVLQSEESTNVYALLDMIYESSFPEEQIFMKTPSRAILKSKKELLVRLLIGLDALGVPMMAEMLIFVRKNGLEGIADSLVTLLELLSRFLEGKQAPEFTTDDVMDAMDFEWHSTSRTGSPLLSVIASATSSPRASAASLSNSPLNPIVSASPFRRAVSDRSMFLSRSHELGAKSVLDKTWTSTSPHHPTQIAAASSKYPYINRYFGSKEITSEIAASPEITLPSIDEKPPSYSLDTLSPSSEQGTQRRHRRQSSSLRQRFAEDTIDEVSWEGSVGASSKRNSSSSSWRRNSSEFPKVLTNVSGSGPSSPINPGLETGEGASDKEILSTIQTQDRKINGSSRKGSRRISPPQPYNEVALWREDIDGFTVDLASSNNKNPAQTSVSSAIHEKSSGNIHETERHIDETEKCIDSLEAAPLSEDAPTAKKGPVEQDGILPTEPSLLSSTIPDDSPSIMSQTPQADISSNRSPISSLGGVLCESKEPSVKADHCYADKDKEDLDHVIDVQRSDSAKHNSAHNTFKEEEFSLMLQDRNEVLEHRNIYGVGSEEDTISVHANDNPWVATQEGCGEDESNNGEGICGEDSDLTLVRSVFKAESLLQEQKLINGSRSDCDVEMDILRRRFAKRLRSLPASMESLMVREGSPGRVVMQESMPWMHVNESSHGKEESEELQIVKGSVSESESSTSDQESTSSSSSSADDTACKCPCQDGKPLTLHELEAEVHSSSLDYAGQPHEFEAGSQCKRDADFKKRARHTQSMDKNNEDDAKNATCLLDITNEEQPGQTFALDNYEGRTSISLGNQQQQNECKSASDKINPEDSIQEGIAFPWISLAPLLLPSTSHVCEDAHDLLVNIHEGESLQVGVQQVGVGGEKDPLLNEQDDARSPSHISSLSLQNDKILNHIVGSISYENEDITQCADNVNSLHDDDDHIQRLATLFPDSRSRRDSLQEDDDRSQLLAAQFEESRRQCAVNVSISYSLHDDHIQRSARQSRGLRSSSAVITTDDGHEGPIRAGDVVFLQDHEHQQVDNLCSPLCVSKKVDLQEASLNGHPYVDPQKQTDQQVLNQPATYDDPTIDRWDIDTWDIDTEEPGSKRRNGGSNSCVGRLARGCLSCCRKPHTNP